MASWFVVTSSAAVVESYHRSQLLVLSEFDDEPATPSDADNATSSNLLRIGPLVEVLKPPGGMATNVRSHNGRSPPPIACGADLVSASRRTVTHEMSKALARVASMSPRQLS